MTSDNHRNDQRRAWRETRAWFLFVVLGAVVLVLDYFGLPDNLFLLFAGFFVLNALAYALIVSVENMHLDKPDDIVLARMYRATYVLCVVIAATGTLIGLSVLLSRILQI